MLPFARIALLLVPILVLAAGEEWTPPAPEAARQAMIAMIGKAVAVKPLRLMMAVNGPEADAEITAADAKRVTISQGGAVLPMPWERIDAVQIAVIGSAAAGDKVAERLTLIDFCLVSDQEERAAELLRGGPTSQDYLAAATLRSAWLRNHNKPVDPAKPGGDPDPATPAPRKRVDPMAALKVAIDTTSAGIDRRLGPGWTPKAGVKDPFPKVWVAPEKAMPKGNRKYQWGKYIDGGGDYSSNQAQVCYAGSGLGIDRVQVIQMDHDCFTEKPSVPWWGGSHPEPHSQSWGRAAGGAPIWAARGATTWSNCGVFLFPNGLMATAGTCTAFGSDPTAKLPQGKIPTAMCVMPRNEFALVTVCDTKGLKAQLALVALTGCKPGFAHEWQQPHPGLPSVAMLAGIKVIGFVDLPGMSVPTSVSAIGDASPGRLSAKDGNIGTFRDMDLGDAGIRQQFRDGNNGGYCNTAGWAVVAALNEDKVAFVDLQPLFQRYREMYFGSDADYKKTVDQGPGPKQWPYTFDTDPTMKPVVVKTVEVTEPCAVYAARGGRACVASRDGTLTTFSVGGLANTSPASEGEVVQSAKVQIGRNPCQLVAHRWNGDMVIAVCRGDREIQYIDLKGGEPTISRRIRDANLIDPVHCEVVETHGVEAEILMVADFKGRKVVNYRLGELVFATQGGTRFPIGPDGKAEFECGGVMEFPGNPYCVTGTNVN